MFGPHCCRLNLAAEGAEACKTTHAGEATEVLGASDGCSGGVRVGAAKPLGVDDHGLGDEGVVLWNLRLFEWWSVKLHEVLPTE